MTLSPAAITVRSLRVGEVRIRPQNIAGTGSPMLWWTFTSRRWSEWLPITVFLIEHEKGTVLFDTGQDVASTTDPDYYPAGFLGAVYRRQAEFRVGEGETLPQVLADAGVDIADIATVAISHLHQDHAGGVAHLAGRRILVSSAELALLEQKTPELHGVLVSHLRVPGIRFESVEFDPLGDETLLPFTHGFDVYGDGTLMLLPTPGHSAGSMSLLVRRADASPLLLVGDVTYDPALLGRGVVPGTGARAIQLGTTAMINELRGRMPELRILAAHDPKVAASY